MSEKSGLTIWYLGHSGFAVKTARHFLVFDYYIDKPQGAVRSLDSGVINPSEIKDLNVLVFASHNHPDHFNPVIFNWKKEFDTIRYILSYDIRSLKKPADALTVRPGGNAYQVDDVQINVLQSTDAGVAFVVDVDGTAIYHAGDLNWWHWEGEPEKENLWMEKQYKKQIDTIKAKKIDIAFIPVDPRIDKQMLWGLHYFMKTVGVKAVFPMHFGNDFSIFGRIKKDAALAAYLHNVLTIGRRGEKFNL